MVDTLELACLRNESIKRIIDSKDTEIKNLNILLESELKFNRLLIGEAKLADEAIKAMQSEIDSLKSKNFTAAEIWAEYSKAVGGKTFDGKPLPEYSKLGTQQKGWIAVANLIGDKK